MDGRLPRPTCHSVRIVPDFLHALFYVLSSTSHDMRVRVVHQLRACGKTSSPAGSVTSAAESRRGKYDGYRSGKPLRHPKAKSSASAKTWADAAAESHPCARNAQG